MIDTHAHLNWPEFADNIDTVINESGTAGLTGIIIASSNLADSQVSVELAKKHPNYLYASVGIHPQQTDPDNNQSIQLQLTHLENLIAPTMSARSHLVGTTRRDLAEKIVAIGECGLDYSPAPPGEKDRTKEDQERLFRGQIDLSIKYGLPLIIHARQANDEVIEILHSYDPLSTNTQSPTSPVVRRQRLCRRHADGPITNNCPYGVFHCYSGGKKRIQKILNLAGEWYFGFDGNLTYDSGLLEVLKNVPIDRILIETDAPFLSPIPFRSQMNKPANLPIIQEVIDRILSAKLTTQIDHNANNLFNLFLNDLDD